MTHHLLRYDADDNETEIEVSFDYDAYAGDPGDWDNPPEPASIEIGQVTNAETGEVIADLTDSEVEALEQAAWEDAAAEHENRLEAKYDL